jgi:ubiquitin carboxyl-terminal hydrolase 5/13
MQTVDGIDFTPVSGPGLAGIKNLGNTCYMASLLQVFFRIPEFKASYGDTNHFTNCCSFPADCFQCQVRKLAEGLITGQKVISPQMWKDLIGRGHHEFGTMKQQDAMEYFSHVFDYIQQKDGGGPTGVFEGVMEERMACEECKQVRYKNEKESALHLFIPEGATSLEACIDGYFGSSEGEWTCPVDKHVTKLTRFVLSF